jgi:hypothetical protein
LNDSSAGDERLVSLMPSDLPAGTLGRVPPAFVNTKPYWLLKRSPSPAFAAGVPPTPAGEPMSCRQGAAVANQLPGVHSSSVRSSGVLVGLNITETVPAVGLKRSSKPVIETIGMIIPP